MQTRGYCENNMKMFYRGEISRKFIHPLHPFYVLAFGTIAITTRVIGLNLVTAMIATQCMPAKFRGTTGYNIFHCFLLYSTKCVFGQEIVFLIPENVSNLYDLLFILHNDRSEKCYIIQWRSKLAGFDMGYMQVNSGGFQ